jgi:hypothetical protein
MPDRRRHRGRHPQDDDLFAPGAVERLRAASEDLAWLLGRGYVVPSALKLVGDRFGLRERQRLAVLRSTASDEAVRDRRGREVSLRAAQGRPLAIDGYNVLITVEAALAGGVLLVGRDGCLRDLASLHGSFKRVEETVPAIRAIGRWLAARAIGPCRVLLDAPVSNSGRLATRMRAIAASEGWAWEVEPIRNPDRALARSGGLVATSDSVVLDAGVSWLSLARHVAGEAAPETPRLDFAAGAPTDGA